MQADGLSPGTPARSGWQQAWRMRPFAAATAESSSASNLCSSSEGLKKAKPLAPARRTAFPYHWAKLIRISLIPAAAAASATSEKRERLERTIPSSRQ